LVVFTPTYTTFSRSFARKKQKPRASAFFFSLSCYARTVRQPDLRDRRKRRLAKYYVCGDVSAAAVIAVISDINNERIITAIAIIEATNIFELILCFL
jgi:hypothetical protein